MPDLALFLLSTSSIFVARSCSVSMEVCLPEDLLLQILSRLPKKSKRKCEVVSKRWENLVKEAASFCAEPTDFGFVYLHGLTNQAMFYRLDNKGALIYQHSLVFHSVYVLSNMGSCNGVLFYCEENETDQKPSYRIYNPVTKHVTTLPRPPPFRMETDPWPTALGYAPGSNGNHYKLIVTYVRRSRGIDSTHSRGLKVAIFNSETGVWKTKPAKFSEDSFDVLWHLCHFGFRLGASSLCFNGSLYWIRDSCLVAFCLKTESFRLIELPQTLYYWRGLLWESEGRLNYCQICPYHGLCIWCFYEDTGIEEMWRKIYSVSKQTLNLLLAETIESADYPYPYVIRVCAFNEHLQIIHLRTTAGLVCYDISEKTMTLVSLNSYSNEDFIDELPFTYRKFSSPDLEVNKMDSAADPPSRKRRRSKN